VAQFLNPQGPEVAEKRENGTPGHLPIAVAENLSVTDPWIDRCESSQEGIGRRRRIQIPKPPLEGGKVGATRWGSFTGGAATS
jgi:hypothetical protein